MATDLKSAVQQSKELWGKLPIARKAALVAVAALSLGGAAYLSMRTPEETWATLFSGIAPEDASKVLDQLKAQNVPFKLVAGGSSIEVPAAKVHELRIGMAAAGLPKGGGIGFEVFDKQAFGTTTFVEQMNYRRALSGELARTIMSLDVVERARVHLAMRERSLYKNDDEPPSASVVVQLRPGRKLSPGQVKGVVHLVASSVEGLRPDRVTVVDEAGSQLWSGDETNLSDDAQHELEKTLAKRVTDILDRIVGTGHSVVVVTAELDTARTERTEELYDKDKVALRSESRVEERSPEPNSGAGGLAGVRGNLPGAPSPTPPAAVPQAPKPGEPAAATSATNAPSAPEMSGRSRLSETRNFEVNRIVNRIVGPKVRLARLHLAVLIDGVTTGTAAGARPAPRGQPELDQIALLAKEAAGLDPSRGDRIEIHSVPFAGPPKELLDVEQATPVSVFADRILLAGAVLAGLLLIAGLAMILLHKKKPRVEVVALPALPLSAEQAESALSQGGTPATVEGGATLALSSGPTPRSRAVDAARLDSAHAAQILSDWLAEGLPEPMPPPGPAEHAEQAAGDMS